MNEKNLKEFGYSCKEYLSTLGIGALRTYGRRVGVARATTKKKDELIAAIVAVLTGEIAPVVRSKLGAPVLNDFLDPKIEEEIDKIRARYLQKVSTKAENESTETPEYDFQKEYQAMLARNKNVMRVEDPNAETLKNLWIESEEGQFERINGVSCLLPLDCVDTGHQILLPEEYIRQFDLREGDVVSCLAEIRENVSVLMKVSGVNGKSSVLARRRDRFETATAGYPSSKIRVYEKDGFDSLTLKYFDWLAPIGKGQRGLVLSAPKSGKTRLLAEVAQAASRLDHSLKVFVLLVDQPPENIGMFRRMFHPGTLVYTTYEDEPERQVFVADFILKRAKRYVESGYDVLLAVDSFNALARAYNDTDESAGGKVLAGGLESKTLHYIKKYFGAARKLEKEGSLTILGAVSVSTGNPADDLIGAELAVLSNFEVRLNDAMAYKRQYPALDYAKIRSDQKEAVQTEEEIETDMFLRNRYLLTHGAEELNKLLSGSKSYAAFVEKMKKSAK